MQVIKVGSELDITNLEEALSIARSGDTIRIMSGEYYVGASIDYDMTFESDNTKIPATIKGWLSVKDKKCIFKNLVFDGSSVDNNLIHASQGSQLTVKDCLFKYLTNRQYI